MATENMPSKTKTTPKTKRAMGISTKISTPSIVTVIGSNRANVAVSKDLRLEREEKYKVCAKCELKCPYKLPIIEMLFQTEKTLTM